MVRTTLIRRPSKKPSVRQPELESIKLIASINLIRPKSIDENLFISSYSRVTSKKVNKKWSYFSVICKSDILSPPPLKKFNSFESYVSSPSEQCTTFSIMISLLVKSFLIKLMLISNGDLFFLEIGIIWNCWHFYNFLNFCIWNNKNSPFIMLHVKVLIKVWSLNCNFIFCKYY